jgi:uncharacterized membrane protein (DUF2068 family)
MDEGLPIVSPSLTQVNPTHQRSTGLMLIAAFKYFKAIILILIGLGALRLIHRDVEETARSIINHFRGDPDNRHLHALLAKLTALSPRRLEMLGIGSFIYAALFLTEGTGLFLQKRWAEWLTVVSSAGFLPWEVYEVVTHANWRRLLVLAINIAIVVYLVRELRRRQQPAQGEPRQGPA